MPIKAEMLISKFNIPEGKILGDKLKQIEQEWIKNDFQISEDQVKSIVQN
jgi:poly(A) polymerase